MTTTKSRSTTKKRRVFLVDDHPVVRRGLSDLIGMREDLLVCGEAASAEQALEGLATAKPDVVVLDISLPGASGMDLIRNLALKHPDLPILVLSMHDEDLYAERALKAGARGYIMKEEAPEHVLTAIHDVLAGKAYLSARLSERILARISRGRGDSHQPAVTSLSDRELQVFEMVGRGLRTRDIAQKLHLSVKTIETYRANIKKKLHLQSAPELQKHAVSWLESR